MPDGYHDNEFIEEMVEFAANYSAVVAGSAAVSYRNPQRSYGDVDIFFLGGEAVDNYAYAAHELIDTGYQVTYANVNGVWNANKPGYPPVQLVVPQQVVMSALELIDTFTLAPQQYALVYNEDFGPQLLKSRAAENDELFGGVTVVHPENPFEVIWSLAKYRGKGYPVKPWQIINAMDAWARLTPEERSTMVAHDLYDFADPIHVIGAQ